MHPSSSTYPWCTAMEVAEKSSALGLCAQRTNAEMQSSWSPESHILPGIRQPVHGSILWEGVTDRTQTAHKYYPPATQFLLGPIPSILKTHYGTPNWTSWDLQHPHLVLHCCRSISSSPCPTDCKGPGVFPKAIEEALTVSTVTFLKPMLRLNA